MASKTILGAAAAGLFALSLSGAALAQSWPVKQITFIVPFAAGGPTDKVARDLAEAMRKPLGTTIIVENVGGAGGTLASMKVAQSASDGYTFLVHHIGMATSPALYRNLKYKTLEDFEYVGMINETPMTLVSKASLPANNFAEFRTWANANKGKINIANAGIGSASHLCGMLVQQSLNIDMQTVPYKGTAPAMTDLLGGQVDLMCDQTSNTTQQITSNKIKAFAVTTPKRIPTLPNLPTMDESGFKGFNLSVWHGLYAPRATPGVILEKVNAALRTALKDPEFVKRQTEAGAVIIADERNSPDGHKKFVAAEINKLGVAIRAGGQFAD
jgi:tripartite-type tricarboxylate transporter receptor subunit TctC